MNFAPAAMRWAFIGSANDRAEAHRAAEECAAEAIELVTR